MTLDFEKGFRTRPHLRKMLCEACSTAVRSSLHLKTRMWQPQKKAMRLRIDEEAKQKRSYAKRQGGSLFLGRPVCLRALTSLLGLGEGTVQRVRAGVAVFSRMPVAKHPVFGFRMDGNTEVKWKGVVLFLWQLYQSAAELMPTDMRKATVSAEDPFPSDKRDPDFELRHHGLCRRWLPTAATLMFTS